MYFEKSCKEGFVKKIEPDKLRAKSLLKTAEDTLKTIAEIELKEYNYNTLLRELYEALHQECEAIGYLQGYKFATHEVIEIFLHEILHEEKIALCFGKYRKLRNAINYYGKSVSKETVEEAKKEIPQAIEKLKKYTKDIIKE